MLQIGDSEISDCFCCLVESSITKLDNYVWSMQWRHFFTPDGRLRDSGVKLVKKVRSGGVDPSIRAEVWPFLLGVYMPMLLKQTNQNGGKELFRSALRQAGDIDKLL